MIEDIDPADIRAQISMWEVLDALDLPYPSPTPLGVKIIALHRHETVPSLHIYDDHWHDFGSGEGGDVIAFVQHFWGCSYRKAVMFLAGAADIEEGGPATVTRTMREVTDLSYRFVTESDPLDEHADDVAFFLANRWHCLVEEHALEAIGCRATRYGLWIPHFDPQGRVIGVKVRAWSGAKTAMKGSTFSTRLWPVVFDGDTPPVLVVCEGESDALALKVRLGHLVSVAGLPSGVATIKHTWFQEWTDTGHAHLVWVLDNDDAGNRASAKAMAEAITCQFDHTHWLTGLLPDGQDLSDAMRQNQADLVIAAIETIVEAT